MILASPIITKFIETLLTLNHNWWYLHVGRLTTITCLRKQLIVKMAFTFTESAFASEQVACLILSNRFTCHFCRQFIFYKLLVLVMSSLRLTVLLNNELQQPMFFIYLVPCGDKYARSIKGSVMVWLKVVRG